MSEEPVTSPCEVCFALDIILSAVVLGALRFKGCQGFERTLHLHAIYVGKNYSPISGSDKK